MTARPPTDRPRRLGPVSERPPLRQVEPRSNGGLPCGPYSRAGEQDDHPPGPAHAGEDRAERSTSLPR
jgi:hypothetical protein